MYTKNDSNVNMIHKGILMPRVREWQTLNFLANGALFFRKENPNLIVVVVQVMPNRCHYAPLKNKKSCSGPVGRL